MTKDIENIKKEARNAFAFLNEKEREDFINKSLLGTSIYFDMYTSFSVGGKEGVVFAETEGIFPHQAVVGTVKVFHQRIGEI